MEQPSGYVILGIIGASRLIGLAVFVMADWQLFVTT